LGKKIKDSLGKELVKLIEKKSFLPEQEQHTAQEKIDIISEARKNMNEQLSQSKKYDQAVKFCRDRTSKYKIDSLQVP